MTLTAMSVDRYQAIVHPLRSLKTRTTKLAIIVCMAIWTSKKLYPNLKCTCRNGYNLQYIHQLSRSVHVPNYN